MCEFSCNGVYTLNAFFFWFAWNCFLKMMLLEDHWWFLHGPTTSMFQCSSLIPSSMKFANWKQLWIDFQSFLFFIWKEAYSPVPPYFTQIHISTGTKSNKIIGEKVLASEACFFVTVFSCSLLRGMITAGPEMAKLAGILRASFGMAT